MKAVKIDKYGGPEVLKIKEITLRKPVNDEVLIEHVAIGLNYIDTYHRSGLYPLILPSSLGLEASGIIKEIGPNVSIEQNSGCMNFFVTPSLIKYRASSPNFFIGNLLSSLILAT